MITDMVAEDRALRGRLLLDPHKKPAQLGWEPYDSQGIPPIASSGWLELVGRGWFDARHAPIVLDEEEGLLVWERRLKKWKEKQGI